MTPEEALQIVFASPQPPQWYAALEALLQKGHAEACAQPTPIERMEAHRQHFLWYDEVCNALTTEAAQRSLVASGLRLYEAGMPAITEAEFLVLLRHQKGLVKQGFEANRSLRRQIRRQYRDRVLRRDLGDELCGTYPFRHVDHEHLYVRSAPALSRPSRTGVQYAYADLEPFVREDLGVQERAALYQSRLRVQTLTADDLQSPDERGLIGQRGVFARTDIPAGVCLGVFGGLVMDPVDSFVLDDYDYVFKASDEPGRILVNGETMMSLVNTRFLFDAQGRAIGHPRSGYNVEEAAFPVRMSDQREMLVHGFFSLEPIAAGTELRICYHLANSDGSPFFPSAQPEEAAAEQAQPA
jgi:hypothetical protein